MQWITIQKTVKYLGFTIDNKLDFHQHIKTIEKKSCMCYWNIMQTKILFT